MAKRKVIYIHGFNSSPESFKATQFGHFIEHLNCDYVVPKLNHEPREILLRLENEIDSTTVLIGSSLGGFFATYLSQVYNLKAAVINPAVAPFELMADYLGPQYNPYQDYHYDVTTAHVEQLKSLYISRLTQPKNLFLLQQMGDEVLDFSKAVKYYGACKQHIEFAGDHSFVGIERTFLDIVKFLNLT